MIKKMTFCEHCRSEVTYSQDTVVKFYVLHNLLPKYGLSKSNCYCDVCKKEVYVSEVADKTANQIQKLSKMVEQARPKLDLIEARLNELDLTKDEFFEALSLVDISPMDLFLYLDTNEYIDSVVQKQLRLTNWERPIILTEEAQDSIDQKMFENLIIDFQFINSLIEEAEKGGE